MAGSPSGVSSSNKRRGLQFPAYGGEGTQSASADTSAATTLYVGSLYEEHSADKTHFIFLGGTRIASVTNPSASGVGGKVLYYHADHLGGTNLLTDAFGVVKELTEYEPFGSLSRHEKYGDDESTAWYYFTGKPLDDETGLYFFGARYYNPVIGRFITPDTIVQSPGNPQTLNRYSYAGNNPVNHIDPSGHSWKKFWAKYGGWFGLTGAFINTLNTGDWANFGKQVAITLISLAANVLLPGSGTLFSNFYLNVGMHILRGAAIGAITGGISSEIMGGSFADGAKLGAIVGGVTGAVQGVTSSEQFQNMQAGKGFRSNASLNKPQQSNAALNTNPPKSSGKDPILDDPTVKKDLKQMWVDSKDGQASVNEQGGFIVDDGNGNHSVSRWPQGKSGSIQPSNTRPLGTVAEVHTHPYSSSEIYVSGPSGSGAPSFTGDFSDFNNPTSSVYGVKHFILDRQGVIEYFDNGNWNYTRGANYLK